MFKDSDNWLDRWLEKIVNASGGAVLELGCGEGRDTQRFCEAGLRVVGVDSSKVAIDTALRRNLDCSFQVGDIRSCLPSDGGPYPVVIASLCLHYFNWQETLAITENIHKSLSADGLLLVRVNSTEDVNYGAVGFPEIEANYYQVDGVAKRFFDEDALRSIFSIQKWNTILMERNTIYRYEKPKNVWEVALTKR